jgi:hypothetical protein
MSLELPDTFVDITQYMPKPRLYHHRYLCTWVCYSDDANGYRSAGQGDTPEQAYSVWRDRCAFWLNR